jgi:hypothetical protein
MLTWRIATAGLIPVMFVCAVLAAFSLDALIIRPSVDGGSVNTLLPGTTYAMATIMKVCIVEGLILIVFAGVTYLRSLRSSAMNEVPTQAMSGWTIATLYLPPIAILVGAVAVMVAQWFSPSPTDASSFTYFSRAGVFAMMVCFSVAIVLAIISIKKHDSPASVRILNIFTIVALIVLFWHFEFYAVGFHQDLWAPNN